MNSISNNVLNSFKEKYSTTPNLYFSPGRINLIGEHVDYNDGFVMPAAINMGIYYAVATNNTHTINLFAIDFNEAFSININAIKKMDGWKNYVLSVVNEFILLGKIEKGFDCVFSGDIPQGSGMSSSAAVEGGLAFALNEIFNIGFNRVELALLCQRAEHNYPNVKCGIMDMYASLNGKKDNVILLDCTTITHEYFPFVLEEYKILMVNSKVQHSLASGEYNVRRQLCEEGLSIIKTALVDVQSFRDIGSVEDFASLKEKMKPEVYNCCKYVVEEIARTKTAGVLLEQHNLKAFGQLMFATHEGLSKLYQVSCDELDFLVTQAKLNPAVIGARLMGGGFGGCTINIVKNESTDDFIKQISVAYQQQYNIEAECYVISISDGTSRIYS